MRMEKEANPQLKTFPHYKYPGDVSHAWTVLHTFINDCNYKAPPGKAFLYRSTATIEKDNKVIERVWIYLDSWEVPFCALDLHSFADSNPVTFFYIYCQKSCEDACRIFWDDFLRCIDNPDCWDIKILSRDEFRIERFEQVPFKY